MIKFAHPPLESFSDKPLSGKELAAQRWSLGNHPLTDRAYAWTLRLLDEIKEFAARTAEEAGSQATLADAKRIALFVLEKLPDLPPDVKRDDNPRDIRPDRTAPSATMLCAEIECSRPVPLTTENLVAENDRTVVAENGKPIRIGCFPAFFPIPDKMGRFVKCVSGENVPMPLCPRCTEAERRKVREHNEKHGTNFKLRLYDFKTALLIACEAVAPQTDIPLVTEEEPEANPMSFVDPEGNLKARLQLPPNLGDSKEIVAMRRALRESEVHVLNGRLA